MIKPKNNMEFKGTKGKWEIGFVREINSSKISFIEVGQKDGFKTICKTFDTNTHPNKLEYTDFETGKANAKLISKAPEMLEVLEKLTSANASHDGYHELKLKAIQLIKEATII